MKTLKRRSLRTVCSEVFILLVTAFVFSMAFPGFIFPEGLGFISLFVLIPVFAVIRNTSWALVAPYGFFFGFMYYIFFNYWLSSFHPLAILIVPIIQGGEMFFLFPALKAADTFFKKRGYILQAVIWVAFAYLAESWFAGYPYGTICYALYRYLPMIQIADITGIWGIIFLQVLPQAFLGNYLIDKIHGTEETFRSYFKSNLVVIIIYAILVIVSLIYGFVKISEWQDKTPDRTWRVATVQHNHDSWEGGLATYRRNFNNLRRYTLEAISQDPDIVVWSETAFVPSIDWNMRYDYEGNHEMRVLVEEFLDFAETLPVPLLTGNADGEPIDENAGPLLEDGFQNRKDYNSVVLFQNGQIDGKYRKQHLVPFTEHFPYEKQMPWLYNLLLANDYQWWEAGDESVVFESDGIKFSTPICFEDVFGYISADFVREGADVIVNMTNDNWSGSVAAEKQHAYIAIFRAIETRKSLVRGTNSGLTCMITPDGTLHDPMRPFWMGYHVYDVPVYEDEDNTFFVDHTDLFAHVAIYLSAATLIIGGVLKLNSYIKSRKKDD